jgi:hypothetical protein
MAAFDTSITPTFDTPSGTSNSTLYTAGGDTSVLVTAANLSDSPVAIRVGVTPSGGSVGWAIYDVIVPPYDAIDPFGPIFLSSSDAVIVRTASASDIAFGCSGLETS